MDDGDGEGDAGDNECEGSDDDSRDGGGDLSSPALKIHISLETKILLDINGCFVTEHRGPVEIKVGVSLVQSWVLKGIRHIVPQGKGTVDTYWLNGKEGGLDRRTGGQED